MLFAQADDGLGGGGGLLGGLGDATQEEAKPALPPAVLPYGAEPIVVLGPVALQVVAYVEERPVQDARVDELEGDEEPAHAPVAVQERVDGLELGVHEAAVDEHGQVALFVQELLKVVERLGHLGHRRRDEGGLGEGRSARADPVLAPAKLAGQLVGATGAAHAARRGSRGSGAATEAGSSAAPDRSSWPGRSSRPPPRPAARPDASDPARRRARPRACSVYPRSGSSRPPHAARTWRRRGRGWAACASRRRGGPRPDPRAKATRPSRRPCEPAGRAEAAPGRTPCTRPVASQTCPHAKQTTPNASLTNRR